MPLLVWVKWYPMATLQLPLSRRPIKLRKYTPHDYLPPFCLLNTRLTPSCSTYSLLLARSASKNRRACCSRGRWVSAWDAKSNNFW